MQTGNISDYLSVAIACLNQTYFRGIDHIAELREFRMLPESFLPDYRKMLTAGNEQTLKEISFRMIQTVRDCFREKDVRKSAHNVPDYPYLAAFAKEARKAENRIVDTIHAHNIRIDSYNTVEDFLAQNP